MSVKNKSGDIADSNNSRAIALSNTVSKVLEGVILACFQSKDYDSDSCQFGFRKGHSTSLGCSVLKNVINYYQQNGSYYVFACFLDLRKAFNMVNHQQLFNKLVNLNFPVNMVKLLIYWYCNQLVS